MKRQYDVLGKGGHLDPCEDLRTRVHLEAAAALGAHLRCLDEAHRHPAPWATSLALAFARALCLVLASYRALPYYTSTGSTRWHRAVRGWIFGARVGACCSAVASRARPEPASRRHVPRWLELWPPGWRAYEAPALRHSAAVPRAAAAAAPASAVAMPLEILAPLNCSRRAALS